MKTLNATTKKAAQFIHAYNNSNAGTLSQVYGRYSAEKARAERDCLSKMVNENGNGFRIISANTFCFSCGWMTAAGLRIETACNSFVIEF